MSKSFVESSRWRGLLLGLALLLGCGGKIDDDGAQRDPREDPSPADDDAGPVDEDPATPDPDNGVDEPSSPSGNGGDELPACELGHFRQDDWEDCAFLHDERCYRTKIAACACACLEAPADSHCLSGLPGGPSAAVEVNCL